MVGGDGGGSGGIGGGIVDRVRRNLEEVAARVAAAAERSGRRAGDVSLMGVTKFQPLDAIYAARDCGLGLFGENRVQEREGKAAAWEGPGAEWHMIGHLQRNKAARAAALFDCVQSVDSLGLALALDRALGARAGGGPSPPFPVMIEVNVSGEASKHGVAPEKCFALIEDVAVKCPRIGITGLMTVGPLTDDLGRVSAAFAGLRGLAEAARARSGLAIPHLSMGMSGDYEAAIREGSDMVRVGTAIFGARGI